MALVCIRKPLNSDEKYTQNSKFFLYHTHVHKTLNWRDGNDQSCSRIDRKNQVTNN